MSVASPTGARTIVDTCVIMDDDRWYEKYQDTTFRVPLAVLKELHVNKSNANARRFLKHLLLIAAALPPFAPFSARYREFLEISLESKGVLVQVELPQTEASVAFLLGDVDATVWRLASNGESHKMVTNDLTLAVVSLAHGIDVEFALRPKLPCGLYPVESLDEETLSQLPNNCACLVQSNGVSTLAMVRNGQVSYLPNKRHATIETRNKEQAVAFEWLTDEAIDVVTIDGMAGSGKTLLTMAAGLSQVDQGKYDRVVICKSPVPVGRDLGFLPGNLEEKMKPWMGPYEDSVRTLSKQAVESFDDLVAKGLIDVEPLSHIRGRTLTKSFIIIDEVQNLTKHEVRTLLTRVGNGSKIVLTGDLSQIDTTTRREETGLFFAITKLQAYPRSAHVTLSKGVRSQLATFVAEKM